MNRQLFFQTLTVIEAQKIFFILPKHKRTHESHQPIVWVHWRGIFRWATHQEISNDQHGEVEHDCGGRGHVHRHDERLDPFPAEHAEYDHERMQEIGEIPPRHFLVFEMLRREALGEQLHANHGERVRDDGEK